MGVLTDFFVADPEELRLAFPAWHTVADQPRKQEVENPFTGKMQLVTIWDPQARPTKEVSDQERLGDFRRFPHAEFKSIDIVKLSVLQSLISETLYVENLQQFDRPALIDPWESGETGVECFGGDFVASLSSLDERKLQDVAIQWAATEEMENDGISAEHCEMVIYELVRLAKFATETRRNLYHYWSL